MPEVRCRWSPTLGALEDTAERIWGTKEYDPETDRDLPAVFFGLYGLPDFYALWRHRGKKWILWAGSDINHFTKGYWLEDGGGIRLDPEPLAEWIDRHCESWVENEVERDALREWGIESRVCPSFLGDISQFELSYRPSERPKLYASVSGDNFDMYGWNTIEGLAPKHPGIEFHLYGNEAEWRSRHPNVIVHGRVPKEQMNREVREMQGGLRLLAHDGFSEILAKSVLWGQWPVSAIPYPHMLCVADIESLKDLEEPNYKGRNYYLKNLNRFPWAK